jgi:hypothetical protein
MPTKEDSQYEFFRALRTSLNMLSLYSQSSPFFAKSIEELKKKIETLLSFSNPIQFGITNNTLMIDARPLEKSGLYNELTAIFHSRKVKSIEIRSGFTNEELTCFLSAAHLSAKQVLKEGGIAGILRKNNVAHILAQELDYSQLLQDSGEECSDVWSFLLGEAVDQADTKKINSLADNVSKIMGNFKTKDFAENPELKNNVSRFLSYLKDHHRDKFRKGSQEILKLIIRDKNKTSKDDVANMEDFIKDLSGDDFAETLSEQIINDDNFDSLSLNVFSMLVDEKKHAEIAVSLGEKLASGQSWKDNPKVKRKMENLISSPDTSSISPLYRNVLFSLMKDISFEGRYNFDRDALKTNYRFLLLNLLIKENNQKRLGLLLERISFEWPQIIQEGNLEYIKNLLKSVGQAKSKNPNLLKVFEGLDNLIANFAEDSIFKGELPQGLELIFDALCSSSFGINTYLKKIIEENKVNPWFFKLFFKFFPNDCDKLYDALKNKYNDLEFLGAAVTALKSIDTPQALDALKQIFGFSNALIKIEVLKVMRSMSQVDWEFLLAVLGNSDATLKKAAMEIIALNEKSCAIALKQLLLMPNPFGKNNNAILENMAIAEELDIRKAAECLQSLSQIKLFWKKSVKNKAGEILRKWNVRKD